MAHSAPLRALSSPGNACDFESLAVWRIWRAGCYAPGMSFATLVDRVRFEFMEMPGLELTIAQAGRLWNMGADDCRFVIDSLVDAGFLRWTTQRTIVRTGRS